MKKLLIALVLGLLLVAALATVASADNGPHGGFTASTDACAGCHRLHSAKFGSNSLLKQADVEALCLSCHGGSGAGTNVKDGVYTTGAEGTAGASLMGGGFDNALMATAWSGKATFDGTYSASSKATTSHHTLGQDTATIWGSGANGTVSGTMVLECTSCHDPHGNAGISITAGVSTRVASYRLLRWQPQGSSGFTAPTAPTATVNWSGGAFPTSTFASGNTSGWLVPDNFASKGTEWYTIGTTSSFAAGDYNANNANNVYNPKINAAGTTKSYISDGINVAYFCAQCHDRYFNNSKLRSSTDASTRCGTPVLASASATLPYVAAVGGVHPTYPDCQRVTDATTGLLTGWGDNGPSGDATYMFRHTSGDIRLSVDGTSAAGAGTSLSRSCVACHVAHGTSAAANVVDDPANPGTDFNAGVADSGSVSGGSLAGGSVLLRMDGRTICLRCHASNVNFTVGP